MQTKKKILIVGGNGEIGQEIINKLSKFNFFIFDIYRNEGKINKNVKFIKGDLLTPRSLKRIPKNFDFVIFLAGVKGGKHSINIKHASKFFDQNVNTLKNFLEFSPKFKFKKIIFSSTEHVYENYYSSKQSKNNEVMPLNYYGLSKLASEKILYRYNLNNNVGVDILRFPRVITKKNNNIIRTIIQNLLLARQTVLNNNSNFNFIFIDDLVSAINKTLFFSKKYRILNVFNNNKPISLIKLYKIIQIKLKKKNNFLKILKKNKQNYNPVNVNISNHKTKKTLKWQPIFNLNKIIDILIKKNAKSLKINQ